MIPDLSKICGRTFLALALVFALAACGGSSKTPGASGTTPAGSTSPSSQASPRSSTGSTTGSSGNSTTGSKPVATNTGPSPVALPWTPSPDVPVDAKLTPSCFKPGTLVTLTVHTKPKAGIAYIAMYSDNGNGAPKPTGNGYGGNDKGISNDSGDFTTAYRVSFDAPPGPGRVDVIVGWNSMWGYDGPTFTVQGSDGRC
jgi:hypothetical protein